MQDLVMWSEPDGNVRAVGSSELGRQAIGKEVVIVGDMAEFLDSLELKLVIAMLDGKNLMFLEQSDLH